jgi:Arc/MetJ-type ribon-helix-helix transcriptional regulator
VRVTVAVPPELEGLIEDALQSGDYESAEQVVLDALWLWAEAVESAVEAGGDDEEEENLLAAMEDRLKDRG